MNAIQARDCELVARDLAGVNLIYADILYHDHKAWLKRLPAMINCLVPTGVIWVQTDYRSVAEVKVGMEAEGLHLVNWVIWAYDWGGRPKDAFGRKHDDLLFFAKGNKYTFNAKAVQVPKAALINSTKTTKIPTDVWVGNFYTTSKERITDNRTGKGFRWQKPEWLLERIIRACTNEGDVVFEPYLGSGTACAVAKRLGRQYVGCDTDKYCVRLATARLKKVKHGRDEMSKMSKRKNNAKG